MMNLQELYEHLKQDVTNKHLKLNGSYFNMPHLNTILQWLEADSLDILLDSEALIIQDHQITFSGTSTLLDLPDVQYHVIIKEEQLQTFNVHLVGQMTSITLSDFTTKLVEKKQLSIVDVSELIGAHSADVKVTMDALKGFVKFEVIPQNIALDALNLSLKQIELSFDLESNSGLPVIQPQIEANVNIAGNDVQLIAKIDDDRLIFSEQTKEDRQLNTLVNQFTKFTKYVSIGLSEITLSDLEISLDYGSKTFKVAGVTEKNNMLSFGGNSIECEKLAICYLWKDKQWELEATGAYEFGTVDIPDFNFQEKLSGTLSIKPDAIAFTPDANDDNDHLRLPLLLPENTHVEKKVEVGFKFDSIELKREDSEEDKDKEESWSLDIESTTTFYHMYPFASEIFEKQMTSTLHMDHEQAVFTLEKVTHFI